MRKFLCVVLALMLALCALPALADVAADVEAGQAMTHDELVEKAKAETGTFVAYGTTSRIKKAAEAFSEKYGIPQNSNNMKDIEIYEKIANENVDMVMIQDGAQLLGAIEHGILVNFVPASVKDSVSEHDQNPLAHQFTNKLFIYNVLGDDVPAIKNVWELTDPAMKDRIIFKKPTDEQVNMNFLIMLTSPEWSAKLEEAYKEWKGEDIDLGSYETAGHKWIAEFLPNCVFGKSDTNIAEEISQETAAGKIGLFVLSKLRSESVYAENLMPAQYAASKEGYEIAPFSGFMYPIYNMISTNAKRPYTAMLFIEYLMSEEGFSFWSDSIGAYSGNSTIPEKEGDLPLSVWKDTLVIEDPEYILEYGLDVEDFVGPYLQ